MTNKEYITTSLSGANLSDADIEIILVKGGLVADADVDMRACDIAIYKRFTIVLKGMSHNVTEGGFSLSWNLDAVKMYYAALCNELGVENVLVNRPKVRNRSNIW